MLIKRPDFSVSIDEISFDTVRHGVAQVLLSRPVAVPYQVFNKLIDAVFVSNSAVMDSYSLLLP